MIRNIEKKIILPAAYQFYSTYKTNPISKKALSIIVEMKHEIPLLIKKPSEEWPINSKMRRFFNLSDHKSLLKLLESMNHELIDGNIWLEIKNRIYSASVEADSFLKKENKKFTFVTGTGSPSLPFILNIPTYLSKQPALIPTGILLKNQIAPLRGELAQGILGKDSVNQKNISGMKFAGLEVCWWYASNQSRIVSSQDILKSLKEVCCEELNKFSLLTIRIYVLRLLHLQNEKAALIEVKNLIIDLRERSRLVHPSSTKKLDNILKLFNTVKPIKFRPDEQDLIQNPFPIVFASNSLDPIPLDGKEFSYGLEGEHTVPIARLGIDIQYAFTNRQNVKKLQLILKNHGVKVLSIEAAKYILGHDYLKYMNLWS